MRSIHDNFNIFQGIEKVLDQKGVFISEQTPDRAKFFRWIKIAPIRQVCYQSLTSLDMTLEVIRSRKIDFIFIYEHKPQYSLFLYLVCIAKNVPCFFIVHGIQQTQNKSLFHKVGFKLIFFLVRNFKFWPIYIEVGDEVLSPELRFKKSILTLHPLPVKLIPRIRQFNSLNVRIGIVGILRGDKPVMPILDYLSSLIGKHPNYELVIGTPFWQLSDALKASSATLVDTSTPEQYGELLRSLDIIVTSFDEKSFFFRPSGIINDAIASGCYVIAPNFPVFKAQTSVPGKSGGLYDSLDQIEMLIEEAIKKLNSGEVNFEAWRQSRNSELLVHKMAEKISDIVNKKKI